MNPKPWLDSYPPGLPPQAPVPRHRSLVALHQECCRRYAALPALENLGTSLSYREWEGLSSRFAAFLHHELGLVKGQRLAIMLPNLLQYPVVLMGALRAGLIVVNINPLFTPRELAHELSDSNPAAIVILENFAHVLEQTATNLWPNHIITTQVGDLLPAPKRNLVNGWLKLRGQVPRFDLPNTFDLYRVLRRTGETPVKVDLSPNDLAFLQYTGGTTGIPKGVMLSHANLLVNIEQTRSWLTCENWQRHLDCGLEVLVTALPLYHIFALTANLCVGMALGMQNHLITDPRNLKRMIGLLRKVPFTCITGVNTLFDHLLRQRDFRHLDFSQLKLTLSGGMPMHRSVAERWQETTGCPVIEGYGLTETSPVVTLNPLDIESFTGSIGLPLPGTDCRIGDENKWMGPGETGELCVKGPQVMQGYWNRPEETGRTFTADGWLKTGDIATMDTKGFFYIVGRKKDMILVSGFNVYPNEIEEVINAHPGVAECAAVGVADERTGEAVKVFVVRKDPNLRETEIQAWCRANLTSYKRPHYIEFIDTLPKSAVGKILRRQLRDRCRPGQP